MRKTVCVLLALLSLGILWAEDGEVSKYLKFSISDDFTFSPADKKNIFNQDNRLALPDWKNLTTIDTILSVSGDWLEFNFEPVIECIGIDSRTTDKALAFFKPEEGFSMLRVKKLNAILSPLDGLISLEIGKSLREFGSAYIKKPTNFLAIATSEKTKYLADLCLYFDRSTLEILYAPNRDFIPDDYTDTETLREKSDFLLARAGFMAGAHNINALYFYDGHNSVGVNYSAQIGSFLIPYLELVWKDYNPLARLEQAGDFDFRLNTQNIHTFQVLAGFNYSPDFINASAYLEFMYNGSGLSDTEWDGYSQNLKAISAFPVQAEQASQGLLSQALQQFSMLNMSRFYIMLCLDQNDYWLNVFRFRNTVFFSHPFGILDCFEVKCKVPGGFELNAEVTAVLYASDCSEFSYAPIPLQATIFLKKSFFF